MPSLRTVVPTEVTSKALPRERRAGFAADPVSGVSRPTNSSEHHAICEFEAHASKCAHCHKPYEVYKHHELLCSRGHRLAQDVATFLYNQEGETFSTHKEDHKYVRVELPEDFAESRSLLKAIERSLRHRSRTPFVSMDRSYFVPPRIQREQSFKVKIDQPKRPLSGEIVDWPAANPVLPPQLPPRRATIDVNNSTRAAKRGSLYESDMAQQRRDTIKYKVEIREPSRNAPGYYR